MRAIGQKDPLIEYQFESYNLFQEMMERVKDSFATQAFKVRIMSNDSEMRKQREMTMEKKEFSLAQSQTSNRGQTQVNKFPKVGRNDPCPCGSGKKYKYCHGRGL